MSRTLAEVEAALHVMLKWQAIRECPPELEAHVTVAEAGLLDWLIHKDYNFAIKAIAAYEQLIAFLPEETSFFKRDILNRYSIGLAFACSQQPDRQLLNKRVAILDKLLEVTPKEDPDYFNYHFNRGTTQTDQFTHTQDTSDLLSGLNWLEQTVRISPKDHRNYDLFLAQYGYQLINAYRTTGKLSYLETGIAETEKNLSELPDKSISRKRVSLLTSKGLLFRHRHLRTGLSADIDASVSAYKEILDNGDPKDISNPALLSDYGNSLHELAKYKRSIRITRESIFYQLLALRLTPLPDEKMLAIRLNNISIAFTTLYQLDQRIIYLSKSINYVRRSIAMTNENEQITVTRWHNLATSLSFRYQLTREELDLQEAHAFFVRAFTRGEHLDPEWALAGSLRLGNIYFEELRMSEAAEAYNYGMRVINELYNRQENSGQQDLWLKQVPELSSRLAYAQWRSGNKTGAIVTLEQGIARHMRDSLNELSELASLLANGFGVRAPVSGTDLPETASVEMALMQTPESTFVYMSSAGEETIFFAASAGPGGLSFQEAKMEIPGIAFRGFLKDVYQQQLTGNFSDQMQDLLDRFWPILKQDVMNCFSRLDLKQNCYLILTSNLDIFPFASLVQETDIRVIPSLTVQRYLARRTEPVKQRAVAIWGYGDANTPLTFTEREVRTLRERYNGLFISLDALTGTSENLIRQLPLAGHLHIATHSFFNWTDPLASGIQLSDGILTMRELAEACPKLNGLDLVFLSGCLGGVNDPDELPDEAVSMAATFLQMGAKGTISSLWEVADLPGTLLVEKFYKLYLGEKINAVTALRLARNWLSEATNEELDVASDYEHLWLLTGDNNFAIAMVEARSNPQLKPFENPFYWAGFYYSGI